MKTKSMKVWVVTNVGGKNLFFMNYRGRLPVFYTKKEAALELARLNEADKTKVGYIGKRNFPGRKIIGSRLKYVVSE